MKKQVSTHTYELCGKQITENRRHLEGSSKLTIDQKVFRGSTYCLRTHASIKQFGAQTEVSCYFQQYIYNFTY
jgi:hypothetical protein